MKRLLGIAALAVSMVFTGQAQSFKFGHINSDELIQTMPEFDSATKKLEAFRKQLENEIELMSVELRNKNDSYTKESKNLTDIVKQSKEQEIVDLNRRIQDFTTQAQTDYQNKQLELFQPVYAKVDKAIKDVGKENGFLYVFDIAKGSLLYFDETKSTNIMALTRTKLGLK